MGLYLYCLVSAAARPPAALVGLDDAPVEARAVAGLGCWVSPCAVRPEASLERVRRHNAVVEAALAGGTTPLPLRFGQWLESEEVLEGRLLEGRTAYLQALQRLEGTVEFGVRVLDPAREQPELPAAQGGVSGTAYMAALAARVQAERAVGARGLEIAARLRAVLGPNLKQERIEALPSRHGLVSMAHLVEHRAQQEYRAAVETVRRQRPELRFLVTGPWPPYSFGE